MRLRYRLVYFDEDGELTALVGEDGRPVYAPPPLRDAPEQLPAEFVAEHQAAWERALAYGLVPRRKLRLRSFLDDV